MSKTDNIKLHMLGLPGIQMVDDFSQVTHISKYTIYQLSKHSDKYYKTIPYLKNLVNSGN